MSPRHSRDEVRSAKREAVERFQTDKEVTSVGIGMTEDRSDYAVTITVANNRALRKLPLTIGTVPVRGLVTGETGKLVKG